MFLSTSHDHSFFILSKLFIAELLVLLILLPNQILGDLHDDLFPPLHRDLIQIQ